MASIVLTQDEADVLIQLEKRRASDELFDLPPLPGDKVLIPIVSLDGRESFSLDLYRGRTVELRKATYQNRVRKTICLVRLMYMDLHIQIQGRRQKSHVHIFIYTERALGANGPSPYQHAHFPILKTFRQPWTIL